MAETNFPKYQLSKFFSKSRNLQAVFRTNDKAEYVKQKNEWLDEEVIDETLGETTPTTQPAPTQEVCKDCGAVKIMGRKGLYCKPCYIKWAEANKKGYKQY